MKLLSTLLVATSVWTASAHAKPALSTYDIASYKLPAGYKVAETSPDAQNRVHVYYVHVPRGRERRSRRNRAIR